MKKVLSILTAFAILTSCNMPERKYQRDHEVKTVTVVDITTGDTIIIQFSGNPGVADQAFKK